MMFRGVRVCPSCGQRLSKLETPHEVLLMPNEENPKVVESACIMATSPAVRVASEGVRISFLEQVVSENSPEAFGRTAVLMSRADASALRDLLAELLNSSEPMQVVFFSGPD